MRGEEIDILNLFGSYTCHIIWKTDNKFPNCIPKEPFDKADKHKTQIDIRRHFKTHKKGTQRKLIASEFQSSATWRAMRASTVIVINNKVDVIRWPVRRRKRRVGFSHLVGDANFTGMCKTNVDGTFSRMIFQVYTVKGGLIMTHNIYRYPV